MVFIVYTWKVVQIQSVPRAGLGYADNLRKTNLKKIDLRQILKDLAFQVMRMNTYSVCELSHRSIAFDLRHPVWLK